MHKSLAPEQFLSMTGYEIRRFLGAPEPRYDAAECAVGNGVPRSYEEVTAMEEALDLAAQAHGTKGIEQRRLAA